MTQEAARVEAGDRALEVLAEIMEMAPIRHTLGLNHTYESGCRCLRCAADSAIESGQSAMNAQERELRSKIADDVDAKMELLLDAVFEKKENMIKVRDVMRRTVMGEAERLLAERGEGQ